MKESDFITVVLSGLILNLCLSKCAGFSRGVVFFMKRVGSQLDKPMLMQSFSNKEQLKVMRSSVALTIESFKNCATTLSRMNFSGYVGHVTIFS